jgi:hypothetical protein
LQAAQFTIANVYLLLPCNAPNTDLVGDRVSVMLILVVLHTEIPDLLLWISLHHAFTHHILHAQVMQINL